MHEECGIPDVRLWNTDEPNLYTCVVRFGDDEQREVFGVRTVECDARRGFRINGERVILRGCCLHHDNGLLGACAYPAAEAVFSVTEKRYTEVAILKDTEETE